MNPSDVVAVITAAGRSKRMGRPKALLEWGGLPLISHQVKVLSGLREVVVVLGHGADALRPFVPVSHSVRVLEHTGYDAGRTSSLVAGLSAIRGGPRGILVVAVDQPLVPRALDQLLAGADPRSPIVVPVHQGRRGHPVLFRGDLLPELVAIDEATEGLRAVVARHRDGRQEVPVDDPGIWVDLNEPADYEAAWVPTR